MKKFLPYFIFFSLIGSSLQAQIIFTDVTSTAGVSFNSQLGESLAWGDYDNDGDQDLFLSTDGLNRLMRNDGNDIFTDVSLQVGLTETFATIGCAFGDLDNDGDLDLFVVTTFNGEPDLLYENLGPTANYNFHSVASSFSGITELVKQRGVSFFDYNRDGLLDIYVSGDGNDIVYKNLGGLKFQNVAIGIGVLNDNISVTSVPTDINNDGWIDIFTSNRSLLPNKIFLNNAAGIYTDITASSGINAVGLGMGVLSFDYDNDLDMDLYWTTWPGASPFQPNAFYQNQGNNTFLNKTSETNTTNITGWGISCNAGDIDNDRFEDFFVANGFSENSTSSILFKNNNGSSFQDITLSVLGNITGDARGVAFADYDNDGDLDLCVTYGMHLETRLWRNDTVTSNNWVTFILKGVNSNKSAIGARIELTANGLTTVKEVSGGAGRGSFNSLPVEFGLATATSIDNVKVRWPNGTIENFNNIPINQIKSIKEGSTLSVNDFVEDEFKINIFPNPFENHFTIDLTSFEAVNSVKIYNTLGQVVYNNNAIKSNKIEVEVTKAYSGLLYLIIELKNKSFTKKIIKF